MYDEDLVNETNQITSTCDKEYGYKQNISQKK